MASPPSARILRDDLPQLVYPARAESDRKAVGGKVDRGGVTDSGGCAGDEARACGREEVRNGASTGL